MSNMRAPRLHQSTALPCPLRIKISGALPHHKKCSCTLYNRQYVNIICIAIMTDGGHLRHVSDTITLYMAYQCTCIYSVVDALQILTITMLHQLSWLRSSVVRTSVSDRRTFPGLRSICSGCVTTYVGITSAIGQPTRPTQPFILPWSINE